MILVKDIYQESKKFPSDEQFGLISQIRRSSVSIPSNIAEGHGRKSTIAFGSLMELETLLKISAELGYLLKEKLPKFLVKTQAIGKMLSGLISSLQKKCNDNENK